MKFRKFLNQKYILGICIAVLVLLSALAIKKFISNVQVSGNEIANRNLLVTSENGASMVRSTFAGYLSQLRSIAKALESHADFRSPEALALLGKMSELYYYERLVIHFSNGDCYTQDGIVSGALRVPHSNLLTRDSEVISDVHKSFDGSAEVVTFSIPLQAKQDTMAASLELSVLTSEITKAISIALFDNEGYYFLLDQSGNSVAQLDSDNSISLGKNFFELLQTLNFSEGYSAQQILDCFENGTSTFSKYSYADKERYAYLQPVGVNNWVLMTVVPTSVVTEAAYQNILYAANLTVQIGLILTAAFAFLYSVQHKARKLSQLNDKCFRALSEQTGNVILEWNFDDGSLTATKNFREIFGRDIVTVNSQSQALDSKMVHPDDTSVFTAVFTDIYSGISFEHVRLRIMHADGTYHWCLLAGLVVSDWRGKPYRAIGTLEDINAQVIRQEALKRRSETDLLTGLYNKATTEHLIKNILAGGDDTAGNCALMIVDLDNFKSINDTLGHQHGDKILKQVAKMISPLVRKSDIVGRIGGDEFFVFFRDFESEPAIKKKAEDICRLFIEQRTPQELACGISISVGISFYPRDAKSFDELYKQADISLYRTKRSGKNGFVVYHSSFGSDINEARTEIDSKK